MSAASNSWLKKRSSWRWLWYSLKISIIKFLSLIVKLTKQPCLVEVEFTAEVVETGFVEVELSDELIEPDLVVAVAENEFL